MRILTIIAIVLLTACGQTGKLYLPESESAATANAAPNQEIQAQSATPDKDKIESELKAQQPDQKP